MRHATTQHGTLARIHTSGEGSCIASPWGCAMRVPLSRPRIHTPRLVPVNTALCYCWNRIACCAVRRCGMRALPSALFETGGSGGGCRAPSLYEHHARRRARQPARLATTCAHMSRLTIVLSDGAYRWPPSCPVRDGCSLPDPDHVTNREERVKGALAIAFVRLAVGPVTQPRWLAGGASSLRVGRAVSARGHALCARPR